MNLGLHVEQKTSLAPFVPAQDLKLAAEAIIVNASDAAFQIGTVLRPHKHRVDVLLGSLSAAGRKQETNFSGGCIVEAGSLIINGAPVDMPWTHIEGNAQAGALLLTTAQAVDWQVDYLRHRIAQVRALVHAQQIQRDK